MELELAYDLAMQVIELRLKRGLTQAELAERSGVDPRDIRRIERGEMTPAIYTLQRMADALSAEVRLVERELLEPVSRGPGLG
jgi:transcriptional regulator with XRE-family HTH domain